MRFLVLFILMMTGCSCSVSYHSSPKLPETKGELVEWIAAQEATVDGLEMELKEAKASRDAMAEAAKNAEGFFAKDTMGTKLSRASTDVEFAAERLTWAKSELARGKAKLETLKE